MRDPAIVSHTMSRIKGRDTSIELRLRRALWGAGMRYRVNAASLPGKPDVVFPKRRVAVFCDGSFWHGYEWERKKARLAARKEYWVAKIERNIARDARVNATLLEMGWHVLRFWDHEIQRDLNGCISKVRRWVHPNE